MSPSVEWETAWQGKLSVCVGCLLAHRRGEYSETVGGTETFLCIGRDEVAELAAFVPVVDVACTHSSKT